MSGPNAARTCRCGGAVETRCVQCGHAAPSPAEALAAVIVELRDRIAGLENAIRQERPEPAGLVDAKVIAAQFGLSRRWVYDHADELGVIRAGRGARGRLRFDPGLVRARLEQRNGDEPSPRAAAPATTRSLPPAELLPVKDRAA